MSIIVTDSGFSSPDIEDSATTHNPRATIDLPSDFDPTQITPELLQARCIRIELPSFADGRCFTLATLLRRWIKPVISGTVIARRTNALPSRMP